MDSNIELIFNKGRNHSYQNYLPKNDLECEALSNIIPEKFQRKDLSFPNIPEIDIVRHYINLSYKNYCVDKGIYPLGSCTMKYNPKINELISRFKGFTQMHPLQEENQGCMLVLSNLSKLLEEITGMDAFTFQPAAGAHGELTGLLIIKKYLESKNIKKNKIIVPVSAHGTNPASTRIAGFSTISIPNNDEGELPLDFLEFAMQEGDVAGIMLTNPNTLGIFESNVEEITRIVHKNEGLCYYDGANLNALLGICRPGDMGFDIIHLNLHKTFSTPHGGGGPGSGPIGVKKHLIKFLPPQVINDKEAQMSDFNEQDPTIGRIKCFWGNFGVIIKAYSYLLAIGREGLKKISQIAVLNANYIKACLEKIYHVPFNKVCKHEFVLTDKNMPNSITTEDIAKRILDYGVYAPTIYFPNIVKGAMMIEPTETESKESLDNFCDIMIKIFEESKNNPDLVKNAPNNLSIRRLNAVLAARQPILHD